MSDEAKELLRYKGMYQRDTLKLIAEIERLHKQNDIEAREFQKEIERLRAEIAILQNKLQIEIETRQRLTGRAALEGE